MGTGGKGPVLWRKYARCPPWFELRSARGFEVFLESGRLGTSGAVLVLIFLRVSWLCPHSWWA